jgi:threonine dehydrogenase-like Zn-dependent dehydrogenase
MKAYVMSGPGIASIQEIADPTIGDYEARVDMLVCGVCSSTDRMLRSGSFRGGVSYPSILGHESVGRVVEVGSHVRNISVGQLVSRCSAYSWDKPPLAMYWGGFAERGVVLDRQAFVDDRPNEEVRDNFAHVVFDAGVSPDDISLGISLSETWSVAANLPMVDRVVGVNGTGIAGLSFVLYARLLGASRVICVGRRRDRLRLAESLGATEVALAGREAKELFDALGGAEVVLDASGSATAIGEAYRWVRDEGLLAIYSSPEEDVPLNVLGGPRDAEVVVPRPNEGAVMAQVVKMLEAGVIPRETFLSARVSLADIDGAFEAIADGAVVKALIRTERI